MAKVYFAPNCAIKYVGAKSKEFNTSLARPKPILKKGDIIIVDKRSAFNLTQKGFGEFDMVESIEFVKSDIDNAKKTDDTQAHADALSSENEVLRKSNEAFMLEIEVLKSELAKALELLMEDDTAGEDSNETANGTEEEVA